MPPGPRPIDRLLEVMTRLRDPESGCPWDIAQDFASIAPYTIEEAYEVADAIERGDMGALEEELGDLLLQVVFHAEMAREAGRFDFDAVADGISAKMVRRHPHVFGGQTATTIASAEAQTDAWEAHKEAERKSKNSDDSALAGVPLALPALTRAEKLGKRAARSGFDWPDTGPVFAKIAEEIAELEVEIAAHAPPARQAEELGDLLFACANLARHLKIDPEDALRGANAKFERRFRRIEALLAERGETTDKTALDELERLWRQAKSEEKPINDSNKPVNDSNKKASP